MECPWRVRNFKSGIQMIVIDTVDNAIRYLDEGYLLAKVTMDYSGMTKECLVAGVLMGLSKTQWWHVLVRREGGEACGLLQKELFVHLYELYYIELKRQVSVRGSYYSSNLVCAIQEMPRYQRRIDSWKELISSPADTTNAYFG